MSRYYRAVATDFDGTLTEDGQVSEGVLATFDKIRNSGRVVVLVTGRIYSELTASDPEISAHVDAVVAENGAVLVMNGVITRLAEPVSRALLGALRDQGVEVRAGEVILAGHKDAEGVALAEIRRLGLDCQMVRNQDELMILPAGITKGTGLFQTLGIFGISRHSAIAIGNAENDHALLDACELRVAVGNGVDSLKERADIVLAGRSGEGVQVFLESQFFSGRSDDTPRRSIGLATDLAGAEIRIPAAHRNILITGAMGSGKSYTTGLVAEKLVLAGYSILVVDPEGDHVQLAGLPGVLVVGREMGIGPGELVKLFDHRFSSVVLDLSGEMDQSKALYLGEMATGLETRRSRSGLPHWIVIDEAQAGSYESRGGQGVLIRPSRRGYVLSTYLPGELSPTVWDELDVVIATSGSAELVSLAETYLEVPRGVAARGLEELKFGEVAVLERGKEKVRRGQLLSRRVKHVRHWHKYVAGERPDWKRFYFRDAEGASSGAGAGNISEFCRALERASDQTIDFHSRKGDFSRWMGEVFGDLELARQMGRVEKKIMTVAPANIREELGSLVSKRYLA